MICGVSGTPYPTVYRINNNANTIRYAQINS